MLIKAEITKKREAEINRLQTEVEGRTKQHASQVSSMKKKHGEAVADFENQIEILQRAKNK